jgi:uncharacterized protein (TIGR03437 family)
MLIRLLVGFCVPVLCLAQGIYTISTVAGGNPLISPVTKIGDGGQAVNSVLNSPGGVTLDTAGNIYIADTGDQVIRRISATTGIITTIAGTEAAPGFSGDGGLAIDAKLHGPSSLAVDKAGNFYISDTLNNRVRKVDTGGNISTIAGSSVLLPSGVGDGGPATSANLNTPKGLALDSTGNLYIADFGNYRVRKVDTSGNITTVAGNGYNSQTFGGFGDGGQATSAPISPYNLALDSSNNIYIADSQDNIVRKVTVSTGIITTPAGNATPGYSGDGASALTATLNTPQGVAVDSAGNIFIADTGNEVIREVTVSNGNINTIAGMNAVQGSAGDGGLALQASLTDPSQLFLTSSGLLYIADQSSTGYQDARIRLLAPALPAPTISSGGVVPIFSSATTVEQGSWISIFGTNFASTTSLWDGVTFPIPTTLGGVSVTIDSIPAYMYVVSPTQINVQVPNDTTTGSVPVAVTTLSGTATASVTLGAYAPSFSIYGGKYAASLVVNAGGGYTLIGPPGLLSPTVTRPVRAGETLVLYGVGFGPTSPALQAGQQVTTAAMSMVLPKITIGGVAAQVVYGGVIETGLFQFNVIVPTGAGTGDQPLVASFSGGPSTPAGVYITLQ